MATETAKIVYLTDKDKTQKYLPKSIGSAVIHTPSNEYETATQTNVSAELDKLAGQLEGKSVSELLTALTNTDGGLSLTVADVVKTIASLNAHTVDGYHVGTRAGQLVPVTRSNFGLSSGYVKYANGLLLQWIKYSGIGGSGGHAQLTLPLSYADTNFFIALADTGNVGAGHDYQGSGIDAVNKIHVYSAGGTGWFITVGKAG